MINLPNVKRWMADVPDLSFVHAAVARRSSRFAPTVALVSGAANSILSSIANRAQFETFVSWAQIQSLCSCVQELKLHRNAKGVMWTNILRSVENFCSKLGASWVRGTAVGAHLSPDVTLIPGAAGALLLVLLITQPLHCPRLRSQNSRYPLRGRTWCRCGRPPVRSRRRPLRLRWQECYRQQGRTPLLPRWLSSPPPFPRPSVPPLLLLHRTPSSKVAKTFSTVVVLAPVHKSTQATGSIVHDPCGRKSSNKHRQLSKFNPREDSRPKQRCNIEC